MTVPVIDRILSRVEQTSAGCWIFQGAKTSGGYGSVGLGGRNLGRGYTHRVTYEYFIAAIPAGLDIDHLCRIRACCNPWHLEPVSRAENLARGLTRADQTHCKRGHEFTPENTRTYQGRRFCRACARVRYSSRKAAA